MGAHVAIKATWNEAGGGPAHLLMAALHGAVALMQVHDVAVAVREDLHLDVARLLDEALDEHTPVAKRRRRLRRRALEHGPQVCAITHHAHAAPTATHRRLTPRPLRTVSAASHTDAHAAPPKGTADCELGYCTLRGCSCVR
jgi:hypothetical protein